MVVDPTVVVILKLEVLATMLLLYCLAVLFALMWFGLGCFSIVAGVLLKVQKRKEN